MTNQTGIIIIVMILLVGLCTASFFIGKGYANSKCDYVEDLAVYGHLHCSMWDQSTDNNFHTIMNTSDLKGSYSTYCQD